MHAIWPACRSPRCDSTRVVSVRRNVARGLATEQIPTHAKRRTLRSLIYGSSQVLLSPSEHFNYTSSCSHGNMEVSTWHWVNTCICWLYSEATVPLMPQGVAGVIGKHEIQKATTDSSHQTRPLLLRCIIFKQTENFFLPSLALLEVIGRWFSNAAWQSLPSSQLSLTQILVYKTWQKEYEVTNSKAPR